MKKSFRLLSILLLHFLTSGTANGVPSLAHSHFADYIRILNSGHETICVFHAIANETCSIKPTSWIRLAPDYPGPTKLSFTTKTGERIDLPASFSPSIKIYELKQKRAYDGTSRWTVQH